MLKERGFLFWPVGCGDATTIVIDEDTVMQLDMRHLACSDAADDDHAPIIDKLVEHLPRKNGKPYLAAFVLTHPDLDHILGFADLMKRVIIGELWFTPRVFREYNKDLCDDAVAFRKEAHRRAKVMIDTDGAAAAGDRLRLIGYDELLQEEKYAGFPRAFHTVPGNAVTVVDGMDHAGQFRAFIHAPFKDDSSGERNETSVAMQIVLGDDPWAGGVLLFGDLSYPTIRRIFDETKAAGQEENLAWQVMLAPHHCSKSVMYQDENGTLTLKQDILDDIEAAMVGMGTIVASCEAIPASNSKGDNPPHAKAKARYQEIAGAFFCTHEDGASSEPLFFSVGDDATIDYVELGVPGDDPVAGAVDSARGGSAPPSEKVGFG